MARIGRAAAISLIIAHVPAPYAARSGEPIAGPVITRVALAGDRLSIDAEGPAPIEVVTVDAGTSLLIRDATLSPSPTIEGAMHLLQEPPGVIVTPKARGPVRIVARSSDYGAVTLTLAPRGEDDETTPLPPSRPRPARAPGFLVALDPGHGGIDPGAIAGGLQEKTLTLTMARRLQRRIDAEPGMSAMLTRVGDRFLPLGERVRRAVAAGADAFVSIHADIVIDGDASGLAVYTLTPEARADAAADETAFAPRDRLLRGQDLAGQGDDVARVLVDLAQRRATGRAGRLAETILQDLQPVTPLLRTRPRRTGDFRVLRGADLPAVLVELGFLTNTADRERMSDRRWQMRVAEAMAGAIQRWRLDDAMNEGQTVAE
ncbi:MAG: N-acetylmuramoyl-L-alanine amidase [Pseudomonadota bacterium]